MYRTIFVLAFLFTASALAADTLSVGSGVAAAGGSVAIPVTISQENGIGVRGVAFKVLFPSELVASVTFARSGAASLLTPLHETALQGSGWCSYIGYFNDPLPDLLGTLTVTLHASAPAGATIPLTLHPPSASLSNATVSIAESVANGNLTLVNGDVTVSTIATPANLEALAQNNAQVNLEWLDVAGADHYQVWRSAHGGAFALVGSPSVSAFTDLTVSANTTYLYRVNAVDSADDPSGFSNIDAATTVFFSGDAKIRATDVTQLRTAVNAFRSAAALGALPADGTIGAGLLVRAQHLNALRNGLNQARAVIGLSTLTYTDPTLVVNVTKIKAAHINELRNGVR